MGNIHTTALTADGGGPKAAPTHNNKGQKTGEAGGLEKAVLALGLWYSANPYPQEFFHVA
jgi:hypothetical protein